MKIKVERPSPEKLDTLDVKNWAIWSKEESVFDWEYDFEEVCFLLEGKVKVTAEDGEVAEFGKGDMVTFKKGLKCKWEITEAVRKHYQFN